MSKEGHCLQRPGSLEQASSLGHPGLAWPRPWQPIWTQLSSWGAKGGLIRLDCEKPRSLLTHSQQIADFKERNILFAWPYVIA